MMVRSLAALLSETHSKVLALRNIDRFVQLETFGIAYNNATEADRELAVKHIENSDKYSLVRWTRNQLRESRIIEELPVTELRQLCGELGVRGYRHLTKMSLIVAVKASSF